MIDKNRIAIRVVQHETHTKGSIMGSLRCLLAESGTINSQAAARPESGLSTPTRRWTEAVAPKTSLGRDRVRLANRNAMESLAQRVVWESERDSSLSSGMGGGWPVRSPVASRSHGI
jgi:hypothetical protein